MDKDILIAENLIPDQVNFILEKLYEAGYSAHIVGGCVRDMIINKIPNDWDIATSARPNEIEKIFEHTIPTGIKHGTITVVVGKEAYEVTTYRIDGSYEDKRRPSQVYFTDRIEEDLARRDFTINAISYSRKSGLVDPFFGVEDIYNKIVRCVGEAKERFAEDALRMVRAIRFSSTLGFTIEEKTSLAIKENIDLVSFVAIERIKIELDKIVKKNPQGLLDLKDYGFYDIIFGQLNYINKNMVNEMSRLEGIIPRLSLMLHLLKKDYDFNIENFYKFFKFDNKTISISRDFVHLMDEIIENANEMNTFYFEKLKKHELKFLMKNYNIKSVEIFLNLYTQNKENFEEIIKNNEAYRLDQLHINGRDLLALGLEGKNIGQALEILLDYIIKNPDKNKREVLIDYCKKKII